MGLYAIPLFNNGYRAIKAVILVQHCTWKCVYAYAEDSAGDTIAVLLDMTSLLLV